MRATVAEGGQVTVPKPLCDQLGITPRTVLDFREESGRLVAETVQIPDGVSKVLGCLSLNATTDEILSDLRGKP